MSLSGPTVVQLVVFFSSGLQCNSQNCGMAHLLSFFDCFLLLKDLNFFILI